MRLERTEAVTVARSRLAGRVVLAAVVLGALVAPGAGSAWARTDFSGSAFQILAPGEYGGLPPTAKEVPASGLG